MEKMWKMLSEKVADEILEMITVEKRFTIGDKLPNENELSVELGVSRTTLREAVRFLVAHKVLEIKRGKGTFVADNANLNEDFGFGELDNMLVKVRDLFEMRIIFEPFTAFFAAERATEKEMEKILEYGNLVEESIETKSDRTEFDQAFHNEIAKATHNEFVTRLMPIINRAIATGVAFDSVNPLISEHTYRDHKLIMDFLRMRDAHGAKDAMRLHLIHIYNEFDFQREKKI